MTRLQRTIRQAQQTSRWLRILAKDQGVPVRALARRLRTVDALAAEVGMVVRADCIQEAQRLVQAKQSPPSGGGVARIVRTHYARFKAEKDERDRIEQEKAWAEHAALQRKK
jgi:hypothetical protein